MVRPGYEVGRAESVHRSDRVDDGRSETAGVADGSIIGLCLVAVLSVWSGSLPIGAIALGVMVGCLAASPRTVTLRSSPAQRRALAALALVGMVVVGAGAVRSQQSWASLAPDALGPFEGWARIVDDPQPYRSSTRVIVEVEGERFETWSRGRARQLRVRQWRGGEWVALSGERRPLDPDRARRVAWQHVVGELRIDWASDIDPGGPVARASNRVRSAIERSAAVLPEPDGSLFRGLVIGDDRDQPREMIERFRTSGLSHLTAVSGQNVAFVLAAFGPLLVRLRPWPRWVVTVGVIAWFVTLTRFEPSIVRAGAMATFSATAFVTGRERAPVRTLALAVIVLVLIDPLLVWSIGFWLSVGATAGVCTVGPLLARRFSRLGMLAMPLGITLGAQVGVVLPSVLVFGRLPLVSVPANLLAVPVAGFVMLYGLPAGLLGGWVPWLAPVLMIPARVGTRWVDTVAMLGARLEPAPFWSLIGWALLAVVCGIVVAVVGRRGQTQGHGDASAAR